MKIIGKHIFLKNGICGIVVGKMQTKKYECRSEATYCLKLSEESINIYHFDYYQFFVHEIKPFGYYINQFYWLNQLRLI